MNTDPAQTLAEHVCTTTYDDLPEHAIESLLARPLKQEA